MRYNPNWHPVVQSTFVPFALSTDATYTHIPEPDQSLNRLFCVCKELGFNEDDSHPGV